MPSFHTKIGLGNGKLFVSYDCYSDMEIEIDKVYHGNQEITCTLTQQSMDQLEAEAAAHYKKACEDSATDCAISRHESQAE